MQTAQATTMLSLNQQQSFDVAVFIRYRKRRFQGARLRTLSNDEIEIAVRALTLPPGTPVELELLHSGRYWRLPAQVARGSREGIGLRFQDPQPDLLRDLIANPNSPLCPHPGRESISERVSSASERLVTRG